jgi:cell division control protein 6
MAKKELKNIFEKFLNSKSLFLDKKILQSNYTPESIIHREDQIELVAKILSPCLRLEKPSNLFVYGKTGTGKTLTIQHTTNQIEQLASEKKIPIKIIYLNCKLKKIADTEYRLIAELGREFGRPIPPTGLPTDEVYKIFFKAMDEKNQIILLILDEIDQLIQKAGDELLYNLTRINSELKNAQLSILGISNDINFTSTLDPRIKSSLSEEEIVFPPYNALQIQDILRERAKKAFKPGILQPGVIEKCAAYAAREHGDARRALEFLRVAGEIAERENAEIVTMAHIDLAQDKIEHDKIIDLVMTQPKQFQATLYSIIISQNKEQKIYTGDIYSSYKKICTRAGLRPLTQRRLSDIIAEFDMLGIINAKTISKGRYGRTREISISFEQSIELRIKDLIERDLGFKV